MKKYLAISFVLFLVVIFGCSDQKEIEVKYDDGSIKASFIVKADQIQGEYIEYYQSGQIKTKTNYIDGLKEGDFKSFYESGQLMEHFILKKDIPTGQAKSFFENGKMKFEGKNIAGKRDGFWIYYYDSGVKKAEGVYVSGLKSGKWNYFENNNSLDYSIDWDIYESGAMKINLPREWRVVENPIDNVVASVIDPVDDSNNFNLLMVNLEQEFSLKEVVDSNIQNLVGVNIVQRGSTTINDLETIWLIAKIVGEQNSDMIQFNSKRDSFLHVNSFFCKSEDFDRLIKIYKEIALSLTFQ